jgi:enoyl-CoA hydratase/carnithine racemase
MRTFHGVNLSWSTEDQVIEVKLHRGPCNEIGTSTLRELEQLAAFVSAGAGGARALVLYSDQRRGFSAGADLTELYHGLQGLQSLGAVRQIVQTLVGRESGDEGLGATLRQTLAARAREGGRRLVAPIAIQRVRGFLRRIHAVFNTLDQAPITTIAAVHGVCFGGGLELALTADLIIADRGARFAFPELRLGLIPGFGGIPRLERDVGNAVVRDLLFTGRSLNARRAHELGLVSQVTRPGEALTTARAAARQACRFDPATTAQAKAFAKPLPTARLEQEIETFLQLMRSPVVEQALERFVNSTDVRPYLP